MNVGSALRSVSGMGLVSSASIVRGFSLWYVFLGGLIFRRSVISTGSGVCIYLGSMIRSLFFRGSGLVSIFFMGTEVYSYLGGLGSLLV